MKEPLHRYGCPWPVGGPCMCKELHECFMEGQKMAAEVFKDFANKLRRAKRAAQTQPAAQEPK